MAKEFAKSFYNSRAWIEARAAVIDRDRGRCQECGRAGSEVDHIIELTPGNISDPRIALDPQNLRLLCHVCHRKKTREEEEKRNPKKNILDKIIFDEDGFPIIGAPPKK